MNSYMNSWLWRILSNHYIHTIEFISWNVIWIHIMNQCVNSVLWRISWNCDWILRDEFEFINLSRFIFKFVSVRKNVLLIQSHMVNHLPFFAVSSQWLGDSLGKIQLKNAFLLCCWVQHYANTDKSKMQATSEEAQGAQSWKTMLLLIEIYSNIVRWNKRLDWNALLLQTNMTQWVQLFWIPNLKIPIFSIWIRWKFE